MRKSAWDKGVDEYKEEIKDYLRENRLAPTRKNMLNGASDWKQYSWGGNSLIYNEDIAERLSSPSELKRTKGGQNRPNRNEEWLDTQARALFRASERLINETRHTKAPNASAYHQTAIARDIANVRKKRG